MESLRGLPYQSEDNKENQHLYMIEADGESVGKLLVQEKLVPFLVYSVSTIDTLPASKDKDLASKLIKGLEEDLKRRNIPGVIGGLAATEVYTRPGWTPLRERHGKPRFYAFNLPEGVNVPEMVLALSKK